MRATRITIRTAALRAGRHVNGVWEWAGQVVATLWLEDPRPELAAQVAAAITRLGDEEVAATVEGREDDYLRLAVDHDAVLPDGRTVSLPAGTLLYMLGAVLGGLGVKQEGGASG